MIDYEAVKPPDQAAAASEGVTLHDDKLKTFATKKTPKLETDDDYLSVGITSSVKSDFPKRPVSAAAAASAEPTKPAIVFRKRKANPDRSTRKPEDNQ